MTRAGAVAAMVGAAACWGGATVASKAALDALPPFQLLAIQLTASVAALWLAVALWRPAAPRARTLRAASAGVLEPGLAYTVGVPGLALTAAGNASVVAATEPLLILAILALACRQPPARAVALAAVAAVGGVALLSLPTVQGLGAGDLRGDALVLLGTAFAAAYVVLSARAVAGIPPLLLTAAQQSVGLALALAAAGAAWGLGLERWAWPAPGTAAFAAAAGVVQYALAFFLYLVGLRRLDPGTAGLFLALTPVFGLALAAATLGERPAAIQLAGAAITIAAVAAILRRG